MPLDTLKESLHDIGRRIIGEGERVNFKNTVKEYATAHGVSLDQAKKNVFADRIHECQEEFRLTKKSDFQWSEVRGFTAAVHELFGRNAVQKFKEDVDDARIFRPCPLPSITPGEYRDVQGYFRTRFDKKVPANVVLRDTAAQMKLMEAHFAQFAAHPGHGTSASLEALIAVNPALGADIGMILRAKDQIESHERRFGKELQFDAAAHELKETAKKSFATMFWHAPRELIKAAFQAGTSSGGKGFGRIGRASLKFFGQEIGAIAKLAFSSGKAAVRGIQKQGS